MDYSMSSIIQLEHPGIILQEEFLEPLDLTPYKVHKATGISQTALGEILKGKRRISASNGLKLAKYFGLSDDYFVKIQMQYDLDKEREKSKKTLSRIVPFRSKDSNSNRNLEI